MISIKNIFAKLKSKKSLTKISNTNLTNFIEINPKEIIYFSKNYFLISNSTELKTIGIILSSGIPLSDLNNKNFTISNFTTADNIISYTLSSKLQIKKRTLVNSKLIIDAIFSIKNLNSIISFAKLNRTLKKLFPPQITTKTLEYIYLAIIYYLQKKDPTRFYCNLTLQKFNHIKLVSKSTSLNTYKNLKFINSFISLRIHTPNLLFYKNSNNKLHSIIATLIESFVTDCKHNKNMRTLKTYINSNLKKLDISYKSTNKIQKKLFEHILLS
ncbi:hypothetical protein O5404_07630 (plasmid) [Borrelia miyamotoi]|uniref:DUF685 domain-containing protein n=1 Tax=Borrelia miyamotoi TaxID=47466 RepID=A0AAX3JQE9_9SPIR|nr:hypothetical protein [Borrelia miyamotoi]WAZ72875.1 hypothetical protein O5404_07630 [Borrelia miyamotoi]